MTQANSFILHDENFPKDPSTGQWETPADSLHTEIPGILFPGPCLPPRPNEGTLYWRSDSQGTPTSTPLGGACEALGQGPLPGPDARSPPPQVLVVVMSGGLALTLACNQGDQACVLTSVLFSN